ncbi:MAG: biopolymer transporter ExbD [bacterium]|nr:biopolymer transporter ExbD [bacterium]
MPKVKIPRKSTSIDMTAMCDVSFLLLTFFMLTSKFRPAEAVPIDIPNSRSQIKLEGVMTISVAKDGAAFFSITKREDRIALLDRMTIKYPQLKNLTNNQKTAFVGLDMFGFSIADMPQILALNPDQYKAYKQKGIPMDSSNCELGDWILQTRYVDQKMKVAIKGDKTSSIKAIKQVIYALTEKADIHKFNLITTLSGNSATTTTEPTESTETK